MANTDSAGSLGGRSTPETQISTTKEAYSHLVETQEESSRRNTDTRAKELKRKGKQEKSVRTRGDRVFGDDPKKDKCILCIGKHSTQKCNFQAENCWQDHIILRPSAPVAEILVKLDSSYRQYLCVDSTMLVKPRLESFTLVSMLNNSFLYASVAAVTGCGNCRLRSLSVPNSGSNLLPDRPD